MASHAFGAVQDIVPDRKAHIASIATYFGAQHTVKMSIGFYALSILLLASRGWPEIIVALAVVPYLFITWPYRAISDAKSARANQGWKHFMKLNQLVGFVITVILILALRG